MVAAAAVAAATRFVWTCFLSFSSPLRSWWWVPHGFACAPIGDQFKRCEWGKRPDLTMLSSNRPNSLMVHIIRGMVTIAHIMVAMLVGTTSETSTAETTEDLMAVVGIIRLGFMN